MSRHTDSWRAFAALLLYGAIIYVGVFVLLLLVNVPALGLFLVAAIVAGYALFKDELTI